MLVRMEENLVYHRMNVRILIPKHTLTIHFAIIDHGHANRHCLRDNEVCVNDSTICKVQMYYYDYEDGQIRLCNGVCYDSAIQKSVKDFKLSNVVEGS